jgi:hypothetical protein
VLSTLTARR